MTELVDHIDSNFRTLAHRASRGIGGFSMGGYGSMHLALKYSDVFGVVVSQSGHYDIESSWKDRLQAAAMADPQDWKDYSNMSFFAQSGLGIAAAISPNPSKPPLFVDLPFEVVDGQQQEVPDVWALYSDADILTSHLARYQEQADHLNGIMIVHGSNDAISPTSQARSLAESMTSHGINHEYWEHDGGHEVLGCDPERWLRFFSENLPAEPVATAVATTTWGRIKMELQD